MTGAFGLEKLLDFGIVLVKPVFVLPRGEAAYFLRSFLENGFQLLPMVLWICFPAVPPFLVWPEAPLQTHFSSPGACWCQASSPVPLFSSLQA